MEEINQENIPEGLMGLFENIDFDILGNNKPGRFATISSSDVEEFLTKQQNVNTKRKTSGDMKVFSQFLLSIAELRNPEDIPPAELNTILCKFVLAVRKKDGSEYEPVSLRAFVSSTDRYFKQKEYGVSIANDIQFS